MSDTLTGGQKLVKGESLTSSNGAYTLTLQDDGNLVLASRGHAIWASGTDGQDVVRAEVQSDGNFVLYTADKPVWHTDTKGKKNVRLVLQDDRNLVLYGADGPAWSTKTETDAPPPEAEAAAVIYGLCPGRRLVLLRDLFPQIGRTRATVRSSSDADHPAAALTSARLSGD